MPPVEIEPLSENEPRTLHGPRCPKCGWRDVRPSRSRNLFDQIARTFGFRAFRCRSCGRRFHRVHPGVGPPPATE